MISALKRLVNSNDNGAANTATSANNGNNSPAANQQTNNSKTSILNNGMQMISQSLQKKFAKGVNYNSKSRPNLKLFNTKLIK